MTELRRSLISKQWSIIAPERMNRSFDGERNAGQNGPGPTNVVRGKPADCDFCPGNENLTEPPEIYRYPLESPWRVRIFPNKSKLLAIEGKRNKTQRGVFERMDGVGAHEMVVATNEHKTIYGLRTEEFLDTLTAMKARVIDLKGASDDRGDQLIEYISVFGNQGEEGGMSKEHAHFQLVGLPFVPPKVKREYLNCADYREEKGNCVFCDMTKQLIGEGELIFAENESFLAYCVYDGKFPFEFWVLPREHRATFEFSSEREILGLARIFAEAIARLGQVLDYPSFNVDLFNTPMDPGNKKRCYHFSWRFSPRLRKAKLAGFEVGTDTHANPFLPEKVAALLREAKV